MDESDEWGRERAGSSETFFEMAPANPQVKSRVIGTGQLSLGELFFSMTMAAIALGCYPFFGPVLLAAVLSVLVFSLVMSRVRMSNPILGGLLGFGVAASLTVFVGVLAGGSTLYLPIAMIAPGLGFVIGSAVSNLDAC